MPAASTGARDRLRVVAPTTHMGPELSDGPGDGWARRERPARDVPRARAQPSATVRGVRRRLVLLDVEG